MAITNNKSMINIIFNDLPDHSLLVPDLSIDWYEFMLNITVIPLCLVVLMCKYFGPLTRYTLPTFEIISICLYYSTLTFHGNMLMRIFHENITWQLYNLLVDALCDHFVSL